MSGTVSRREMLQGLLAAGVALGADWPALAQGEEVVPFIDLPAPAAGRVPPSLQNFFTPSAEFFAVQHYAVPPADRSDGLHAACDRSRRSPAVDLAL